MSGGRRRGFTLLELMVAFAILALFVLPILEIVAAARVRALKYTRDRMVQDLAQRKLFDHIYSIDPARTGSFELEGRPDWIWEIFPPEIVSQGAQTLLQYTIEVRTPQSDAARDASSQGGDQRPAFQMSIWTFPSEEWLAEQEYLQAMGLEPALPMGTGSLPGGTFGQ